MHDLDRLVASLAPDPGPGMTPTARELMDEITARPVTAQARAPRRRRAWAAVPVLATLATLFSFGVAQAPASAALDIRLVDGDYVITVKDLMAEPEVYQRELKARGLDITLAVVPTSASQAGQIFVLHDLDRLRAGQAVPAEGPITTIDAPGSCERSGGCPIGVKVPADFDKKARITLGRRARPGEKYKMPPGIAMPGEPLHCVAYVNKTVAEVAAMLRERGVTPAYVADWQHAQPSAPAGWYVHDGVMSADGEALLLVGPEPRAEEQTSEPRC
ncbi:hypothetical protein Nocox_22725 [Nonomuraea coxensis DSM 45129]|uniref:PASTA domain-containing protein n=1 Tax=Nonomuraea coxensis DSM 45129 TaxID=1122611 RepID=A0ABX8U5Z1_9ACTN|nr:hypothetical protein [Nonomuraea coxensis]QYC42149.1 hypothetical protein Nocox_22725 [Nonomuraea coxensis DSM 45129]